MERITALKIIPLVMLFIFTAAGCSLLGVDSGADEISKLNTSIEEITGGDFKLPLHDDYPLLYVYQGILPTSMESMPFYMKLHYSNLNMDIDEEHYFMAFHYSIEDKELIKIYEDEARTKEIEDSQGISILYGPHDGSAPIMINYSPALKNATLSGADETGNWNINGNNIEYFSMDMDGRIIISVHLNLSAGGVNTIYYLSDEFTEEDAKEFTANLVNELY